VQAALAELQGDIDTINAALPGYQPLDSDLTTLAGLSNAKGTIIAGSGSAWAAVAVGTNGLVTRANSSATNGVEWGAGAPAGTLALFAQTAAPTGWTKSTTYDDAAIRVVSGTASSGGSTAFSTVMAARTIARANLPNVTLGTTSNGAHSHSLSGGGSVYSNGGSFFTATGTGASSVFVDSIASGGAHTHTTDSINGGVTQTTMDFAVKYLDTILATAA
jgi:hypothetical protein